MVNFAPYFLKSFYYIKKQIENFHFNNLGRNFDLIINNRLHHPLTISKDSARKNVVDFFDNFEIRSSHLSETLFSQSPENKFEQTIRKIYDERSKEAAVDLYKLIEKEIIEFNKSDRVLEYEIRSKLLEGDSKGARKRNLKDLHVRVDSHMFKFYSENFDNKKFFFCLDRGHGYYFKFRFNYFKNNKQVKVSTNYRFKNSLDKKVFIKIFRKLHAPIRKNSSNPQFSESSGQSAGLIKKSTSDEFVGGRFKALFDKQLGPGDKVAGG